MFGTARRRCLALSTFVTLALLLAFAPAPAVADPACEEQCGISYWECSDACGAFGGPLCEQSCVNAYNSCIGQCNSCPSVRNFTTFVVNSNSPTGSPTCYKNSWTSDLTGKLYQKYNSNRTVYHWRETTQCNGAKSTQLLSTTTEIVDCLLVAGQGSCSPSTNISLPICI